MRTTAALSLLLVTAVTAADWSYWRGPSGQNYADAAADPPVEWSASKNVRWKTRDLLLLVQRPGLAAVNAEVRPGVAGVYESGECEERIDRDSEEQRAAAARLPRPLRTTPK